LSPQLMEIPGIGFSYHQKLLWKFKSVKNIKLASLPELQEVIGKAKGKVVYAYFREQADGRTGGQADKRTGGQVDGRTGDF